MKSVFFYFCNRAGYIDDKLSNLKVCIMRIPSPEGSESLQDILRGCDRELHNANRFAPLGGKYMMHVRIHVSLSLGH